MKISQKGLYSLQAPMMLARNYKKGTVKIREIASEENLPEQFLDLLLEVKVHEANGCLFLDERDLWPNQQFVTAHLIVRTEFPQEHPDVVKKWLAAHVELTDWINAHPDQAKRAMSAQIQKETGKALAGNILDEAFGRMQVTYDRICSSLMTSAKWAFDAGFLGRQMPDLSGLYDLNLLNRVLMEKGKRAVQ